MSIEKRLETLERDLSRANRRNRLLLGAMGLGLGIAVLIWAAGLRTAAAQTSGTALKEVHANRFILDDGNGRTRAELYMTEDGPMLRLYNENKKSRAVLYIHGNQAGLGFKDENDKLRSFLGVGMNVPMLTLYDENEKPRAMFNVLKTGPYLGLTDEKGKPLPIR